MGTFIITYIALALIVFPVLYIVFPRQAILKKGAQAAFSRSASFRSLADSEETALTIRLLRLPDSWIATQVGRSYIIVDILLLFASVGAVYELHIAVIVVIMVFFALALTVAPILAVLIARSNLHSTFKAAKVDYASTVTYSLILVASQIRGTTTTENALSSLPSLLPSSVVQRFVNDIAVFRTNAGGDASTGQVLKSLGEAWDIPSCILIGDLLDSGLESSDIADQMLSQVEMGYMNLLTDQAKKYKTKETIMTGVVLVSFMAATFISIIPMVSGVLTKGGL
jgi:hypothetical protein